MYCVECERFFDEPVVSYDDPSPADVDLPQGQYAYNTCPHCGSDWIEESKKCTCGNDVQIGIHFCDECKDVFGEHINQIKRELNLSQDEVEELVAEYFGW